MGAPEPAEHPVRRLHPTLCSRHWETLHSPRWTLSPERRGGPALRAQLSTPKAAGLALWPLLNVQVSGAGGPDPLPPTLGLRNMGEHTAPLARPASVHCLVLLSLTPQSQNLPAAHREPPDASAGETLQRQRAWGWGHSGRRGGQLQSPRHQGKLLAFGAQRKASVASDQRWRGDRRPTLEALRPRCAVPRVCKRDDLTSQRLLTLTGNLS